MLGCGDSGDVLPCMQSKNWTEVEAAGHAVAGQTPPIPGRSEPPFQPSPDGVVVFDDYPERSARGEFARLPYLAGNNDYEAGYYKVVAYDAGTTLTETQWETFDLYDFTCPIASELRNRTKAGVPAWRFRYFGDWDNLRLYPGSRAYHGSDLQMVFGGSQDVTGLPESAPEMQMQNLFMKAWATFAEDPVNGLVDVLGWPRYDPNGEYLSSCSFCCIVLRAAVRGSSKTKSVKLANTVYLSESTLIRLGYNYTPIAEFVDPSLYDSPCASLNQTS